MRAIIIIGVSVVLVVVSLFSVDAGLYSAYSLLAIALGSAVVLSLLNTLKSPGEIKKMLYAIAGMVVLFVISYALAGSEVSADHAAKGITGNTSKMVGAGLIMFYLIAVLAVLGLVFSEINKAFK
jgi:hypothetical protein